MKKILFISDYNFNIPGGAQKSMEIIMEGLSDEYEFVVLMPGEQYFPESKKYRCVCLNEFETFLANESVGKTIRLARAFKKAIDKEKPDMVHAHMASGMSVMEVLKKFGMVSCKLIYTERGVADQYSKITRAIIKNMAKDFDITVTTTSYNKVLYKQLYGVDDEKITVIPNTAGPIFDEYEGSKKEKYKKQLGLENSTVVMFNARMTYNKNWELSIEILKWLSGKYNFSYIMVIGSDQSAEDKQKCIDLLHEARKIAGNDFFRGYVDLSLRELNDLYYASDIFVMTSRSESFGRTAIEAMSRANVVFGTKIDGLSEVIGLEAFLFDDIDSFKMKFVSFLDCDLKENQNMFLHRFTEKFSLKTNLGLHRELYSSLLSSG